MFLPLPVSNVTQNSWSLVSFQESLSHLFNTCSGPCVFSWHLFPILSLSQWVPKFQRPEEKAWQNIGLNGSAWWGLLRLTAASTPPSSCHSNQGNSSIPLGLVPTCLLTPTISQSWTRSASEKRMLERWLADQKSGPKLSVLRERKSLVNHQPRGLSSSSTELPAWHGGSSCYVSGGASQPLAYRILQTGTNF